MERSLAHAQLPRDRVRARLATGQAVEQHPPDPGRDGFVFERDLGQHLVEAAAHDSCQGVVGTDQRSRSVRPGEHQLIRERIVP